MYTLGETSGNVPFYIRRIMKECRSVRIEIAVSAQFDKPAVRGGTAVYAGCPQGSTQAGTLKPRCLVWDQEASSVPEPQQPLSDRVTGAIRGRMGEMYNG